MAITNGYTDLATFKARLFPDDSADTTDDSQFELVIEAVSRWIDENRGRRFYAVTETRYYTADNGRFCVVDDLLSVTTLKTDEDGDRTYERTWTANTDYELFPRNAGLDGKPYIAIGRSPLSNYTFPTVRNGVEILGSFGFSSTTPKHIQEACLLASMRVWERKDLLFGTAGNAELGNLTAIVPLHKDGELMAPLNTVKKRYTSNRPR